MPDRTGNIYANRQLRASEDPPRRVQKRRAPAPNVGADSPRSKALSARASAEMAQANQARASRTNPSMPGGKVGGYRMRPRSGRPPMAR